MPYIGGIYRHYSSTGGDHHTYEVMGFAKHSETEEELVVYKPLFDAESTRLGSCQYAARPLVMWDQEVEYQGKKMKRFELVS